MSNIIAKVQNIDGEFSVQAEDGSIRVLSLGDNIYSDDLVIGNNSNYVVNGIEIKMLDGSPSIMLTGDEKQLFDASLLKTGFSEDETITNGDSIVAMLNDTDNFDDIIDDSNNEDIDDETAAGEIDAPQSSEGGEAVFAEVHNTNTDISATLRESTLDNRDTDADPKRNTFDDRNINTDLKESTFGNTHRDTTAQVSSIPVNNGPVAINDGNINVGNETAGAAKDVIVTGIYRNGSYENVLDGVDDTLVTSKAHSYFEHGSFGHTGYNYMGGHDYFADNAISFNDFKGGVITFSDGTVGVIDAASNGVARDRNGDGEIDYEESAYIYYNAADNVEIGQAYYETTEDRALRIDVLSNDSDPDGDTLTLMDVQNPVTNAAGVVIGTAVISGGKVIFTPNDEMDKLGVSEFENVSFTYAVSDGETTSNATVNIKVMGTNDGPVVGNDIDLGSVNEDNSVEFTQAQLLANSSDIDTNDVLSINSLSSENGTIVDLGDGNYRFTPNENYNGDVDISFNINDGHTNVASNATLTVDAVNDAVVANDDGKVDGTIDTHADYGDMIAGAGNGVTVTGIYAAGSNVNILDGKPELETLNDYRFVGDDQDRGYNYMGNHDYFSDNEINTSQMRGGIITFSDGSVGIIDSASNGVERDRDGDGDIDYEENAYVYYKSYEDLDSSTLITNEDASITLDVLANDTDADGDILSITQIQGQDVTNNGDAVNVTDTDGNVLGTAQIVDGKIQFNPTGTLQNLNDSESQDVNFEYTVSDGTTTDTANVTVNVTGTTDNIGPVAFDDNGVNSSISVNTSSTDGALVLDSTGDNPELLGGATSVGLTISLIGESNQGQASVFSYASSGNHNEFLVFSDGNNVRLYIDGANVNTGITSNELFDGEQHEFSVSWDSATGEAKFYLDGNLEGTQTIATGHTIDSNGVLMLGQEQDNVGGRLDVNQIFKGEYKDVSVSVDGSEVAHWDMNGINANGNISDSVGNFDLDVVGNVTDGTNSVSTDEDSAITIDVLANDTDADGDTLSITEIQGQDVSGGQTVNVTSTDGNYTVLGSATVVDAKVEFTPSETLQEMNDGENQEVSFEYTVSDGTITDTASVTVNVTGSDDVAIIEVDSSLFTEGSNNVDLTGDGDDTILFDASDRVMDGGEGLDTLVIAEDIDIDFSALSDYISNIETIDLGAGEQDIISLHIDDVLDMTDSDNILRIDGDDTDSINLDTDTDGSGEWTLGDFKTDAETGQSYQEYVSTEGDSTVTLEISEDIQVTES